MMYFLAKHTDLQEKLANEVISRIGRDGIPSGMLRCFLFPFVLISFPVEDVQNMMFLDRVINETMRCRAPVPIISRVVEQDTHLDDYFLPKGV